MFNAKEKIFDDFKEFSSFVIHISTIDLLWRSIDCSWRKWIRNLSFEARLNGLCKENQWSKYWSTFFFFISGSQIWFGSFIRNYRILIKIIKTTFWCKMQNRSRDCLSYEWRIFQHACQTILLTIIDKKTKKVGKVFIWQIITVKNFSRAALRI